MMTTAVTIVSATAGPTRQKNVRQKNAGLFFCLAIFCLAPETMITAMTATKKGLDKSYAR
jgi:hypothetical protein